jgi:hypothetical protein
MAVVAAENALVAGVTKRLRDQGLTDDAAALAVAQAVVTYLEWRTVRPLLTRFVAELHAADLDTEAMPVDAPAVRPVLAEPHRHPAAEPLVDLIDDVFLATSAFGDLRTVGQLAVDILTDPAHGDVVRAAQAAGLIGGAP